MPLTGSFCQAARTRTFAIRHRGCRGDAADRRSLEEKNASLFTAEPCGTTRRHSQGRYISAGKKTNNSLNLSNYEYIKNVSMRKFSLDEMAEINGGVTGECLASIGASLIFGVGGIIASAASGGLLVGFAIANCWTSWGLTMYTCYES